MTKEEHRKLGIQLFNATWKLIDTKDRSKAQDFEMMHAAHASAYHWLKAGGTPTNEARSQWQISRVYALLNMGESALAHGRRSLDLCLQNSIGDFDLAFGYEATARAYAILGNTAEAAKQKQAALAACADIQKKEDRSYVESEIDTIG